MRYHIVVYVVPDPLRAEQIPFVDEEWNSGADQEAIATAADVFIEENT